MRIADLFCGAGGSAVGLYRAGFEVVGFDIETQGSYPFKHYVQNALTVDLSEFDAVWASPPCQLYSISRLHDLDGDRKYPDYIPRVRETLIESGLPYIMENVGNAPLNSPVMLCGESFNLRVTRHRFFESNQVIYAPKHPVHRGLAHTKLADGNFYYCVYGHMLGTKEQWGQAMGIDWMKSKAELSQAIPPAYSEYLGRQFRESIK